jgi:hypothetical protein
MERTWTEVGRGLRGPRGERYGRAQIARAMEWMRWLPRERPEPPHIERVVQLMIERLQIAGADQVAYTPLGAFTLIGVQGHGGNGNRRRGGLWRAEARQAADNRQVYAVMMDTEVVPICADFEPGRHVAGAPLGLVHGQWWQVQLGFATGQVWEVNRGGRHYRVLPILGRFVAQVRVGVGYQGLGSPEEAQGSAEAARRFVDELSLRAPAVAGPGSDGVVGRMRVAAGQGRGWLRHGAGLAR